MRPVNGEVWRSIVSSKSKIIGTKAESAVVKYLRENGFGGAERRALHGSEDLGDILVCPGVIAEVKAGEAAFNASDGQLAKWVEETFTETKNAGAQIGFLVVARKYKNPSDWFIVGNVQGVGLAWTRLRDFVPSLRRIGYGDPLEDED